MLRGKTEHGDNNAAIDNILEMILDEFAGDLNWGTAQSLVAHLPPRLGRVAHLASFGSSMTRFAPAVMLSRLSNRQGVGQELVTDQLSAVLALLERRLPSTLWKKITEEVPSLVKMVVSTQVKTVLG